jgi:Transcription factor WhiB
VPWQPWTPRPARERAAEELRRNPLRGDREIAAAAGVSRETVAKARHALESMFLIGKVPLSRRGKTRWSPVREAIIAHPDWTARQLAAEAHVSRDSVHKMRSRDRALGNRRLADAAVAVDSLSVLKIIPRPCAHCRQPHPFADGRARYCSPACAAAADRERKSRRQLDLGYQRPPLADPDHPPPQHWELPKPPDFSRGACTTAKPHMRGWWTSSGREEREAAATLCRSCPVLAECESWSLALPLGDDAAVYAGMTPAQRRRKRQALLKALAAQAASTRPLPPRWLPPGTETTPEDDLPCPQGARRSVTFPQPGTRRSATAALGWRPALPWCDRIPARHSAAQARSAPLATLAALATRNSQRAGHLQPEVESYAGPMPFDYESQPEFAGAITEPRTGDGRPALDIQALRQHTVRLPRLDPSALERGEYVTVPGPIPFLPDPEERERDRDRAAADRDTTAEALRATFASAARSSGADALTAKRTADAILDRIPPATPAPGITEQALASLGDRIEQVVREALAGTQPKPRRPHRRTKPPEPAGQKPGKFQPEADGPEPAAAGQTAGTSSLSDTEPDSPAPEAAS